MEEEWKARTELLIGKDNIQKLKNSRVIVYGIGGVGSFAVEGLIRSGIENIILVDNDVISPSNLNRQIHATVPNIGRLKVECMKERIISINPNVKVENYLPQDIGDGEESLIDNTITYVIDAVDTVKSISLNDDDHDLGQYISTLVRYATESDRADMFAKCALYRETKFPVRNFDGIEKLIESVENLLDAREYRDIIDRHVTRDALLALREDLLKRRQQEKRRLLEEAWVNDVVGEIQKSLRSRTSAVTVSDCDFYEFQMNRMKVKKFNELVNIIKEEAVINKKTVGGFTIQTQKRRYNSASELKSASGKKSVSFSQYMNEYTDDPYRYLLGLMEMTDIPDTNTLYTLITKF